ncbi:MAG: acetate kinase [Candidatus Omnitrophica bacterium]|nr:acetate kinase [Candidatus Omnitrophota bacterium]
MKILVINTGSSSIKYELFDADHEKVLAGGVIERIGQPESFLLHFYNNHKGRQEKREEVLILDHAAGLKRVAELLQDQQFGAIKDPVEITAVGHRVVHGGECFKAPTHIDEAVIETIRDHIALAPLHNPANLKGIEVARDVFPNAYQVAVFDTAFHQSIPPRAFLYALPMDLYKKNKIRRYGFHGISHAYVSDQAARWLSKSPSEVNMITAHLGNGCSMAAIQGGRCVDTSMGMTPLEGLVMGTRSGDIDPAIIFYLADHLKMSIKDINTLLNKESGLKGLCGENDVREIIKRYEANDEQARLTLEICAYRIKKYIGAYIAVLGRCHCLVFTAGIGERSVLLRFMILNGLERMGIELDSTRNASTQGGIREISRDGSPVKVLVIPTNEELMIARATRNVVEKILSKTAK